jgi:protein O-mannosyl-transferase
VEVLVENSGKMKYYLTAAVALLTFLIYLPALRNDFVYWDDNLYVFENPNIQALDANFFRWAFLGFSVSNWHPVTWLSHALDYAVWGLDPFGHHLTSIIIHSINTALVVLLAMTLLEIARERSAQNASDSFLNDRAVLTAAGVTGLLFGIHPVHVESVAWVAERKDLLSALFFLLSIMAYASAVRRQEGGKKGQRSGRNGKDGSGQKSLIFNKYYIAALGFFVLALMSKPMAVTLPVVLLVLDWYPVGRVRSVKTFRSSIIEKIPFIVLSMVSSLLTILAQRTGEAIVSIEQIPASERIIVAAKSLIAYLGKILVPIDLIPFYPYPKVVSLFSFDHLLSIGMVTGITAACVIVAQKQKFWLAAWGYYVITLIPVLGIIQVGAQSMADRYTYLPSLGPFLIAGVGAGWAAERILVRQQGLNIRILSGIASVIIPVVLGYLTLGQIRIWQDSITLWSYVIDKSPVKVSLAYSQRGIVLAKQDQMNRAIADLNTAVSLNPYNYDAYMNLGVAYQKLGQIGRAKESVEKAISIKPSSHEAYFYRGVLHEEADQLDQALADYTQAITLAPSDFEAYNNRGVLFGKMGRLDKAIADYSEAIRIDPRHIDAYSNRGIAYTLSGQYDRALEDLNAAVLLGPTNPVTYYNRGSFYRRTGRNDRALADFKRACDLGDERACGVVHQQRQQIGPR